MRKIPTIFERDWDGDRSRVLPTPTPGCEWVFAGEGTATRKYDGTCVKIENGAYYRRHEVREGKQIPENFEEISFDEETGKRVGWIPVGDGPEDKWHRDGWARSNGADLPDGTYELVGPKIDKNPEDYAEHTLIAHATAEDIPLIPRTFEGLKAALENMDVEGIVFHHPDGRMAKIKKRDFGFKRKTSEPKAKIPG